MNTLEDLIIQIDASSELLRAELRKANDGISQFERNTNSRLDRVNNSFGALGKAAGFVKASLAGLAVGFGVGFIENGARSILNFADDLATVANNVNINVERFQTLKEAFRSLEVGAESFQKILSKLIQVQGDVASGASNSATKALDRLGVSADVLSGKIQTTDQLLDAIAKAMGRIPDPAQKAALAADLVGSRLGTQFAAVIRDGGVALKQLEQQFRATGAVIDDEYIEKLAEANETWDRFVTQVQQRAVIFAGSIIKTFGQIRQQIDGFKLIAKERGIFAVLNSDGDDALRARTDAQLKRLDDLGKKYRLARQALENVESGVIKASDQAVANLKKKIASLEGPLRAFGLLPAASTSAPGTPRTASGGGGGRSGSVRSAASAGRATPAILTPADQRLGAEPAQIDTITLVDPGALADLEQVNLELIKVGDLSKVAAVSVKNIFSDELLARIDDVALSFSSDISRSLADIIVYGGNVGNVLESAFKRMAAAVLEAVIQTQVLLPLLKSIGGSGGGSGSANLFGNLFSAALSAFGGFRETGGPVARGRSYVVGERGRELFIPNSSGRIIDAAGTRAALSGGQVEVNVNVEPSPLFITTVQQSSAQAAQGVVRNVQRRRLPAAIGQGR